MNRCFVMAFALCAFSASGATPAPAPVNAINEGEVRMVIRPDAATVRETFRAPVGSPRAVVRFPQLPSDVDPSSIMLIDRRRALQLVAWQREGLATNLRSGVSMNTNDVHIHLRPAASSDWPVISATFDNAEPGEKRFDLVYQMTGLVWQASYDVLIRGSLTGKTESISVDVDGMIEVSNGSTRTFSNVTLWVIGPDTLGQAPLEKPPGILELSEDNPMGELWRHQAPEPLAPNRYEVGRNLTIQAGRSTMFSYVAVNRRPVEQRLLIRAEDIPTDTRGPGGQPSLFILLQNKRDYAAGRAAPPGPAAIHVGSRSAAIYQKAWFKHTPVDGEISIDMGRAEGVQVRRVTRSRTERADGGYEQIIELRISNTQDDPVRIVIDEAPPVSYTWTVLRASLGYDGLNRRMIFATEVSPHAERVINYTVRVMKPED